MRVQSKAMAGDSRNQLSSEARVRVGGLEGIERVAADPALPRIRHANAAAQPPQAVGSDSDDHDFV
jgi:hypothetical protein